MKVKEAIMRLRNKNTMFRDIGKTIDSAKSTVWNIIKKKENTGESQDSQSYWQAKKDLHS